MTEVMSKIKVASCFLGHSVYTVLCEYWIGFFAICTTAVCYPVCVVLIRWLTCWFQWLKQPSDPVVIISSLIHIQASLIPQMDSGSHLLPRF